MRSRPQSNSHIIGCDHLRFYVNQALEMNHEYSQISVDKKSGGNFTSDLWVPGHVKTDVTEGYTSGKT